MSIWPCLLLRYWQHLSSGSGFCNADSNQSWWPSLCESLGRRVTLNSGFVTPIFQCAFRITAVLWDICLAIQTVVTGAKTIINISSHEWCDTAVIHSSGFGKKLSVKHLSLTAQLRQCLILEYFECLHLIPRVKIAFTTTCLICLTIIPIFLRRCGLLRAGGVPRDRLGHDVRTRTMQTVKYLVLNSTC